MATGYTPLQRRTFTWPYTELARLSAGAASLAYLVSTRRAEVRDIAITT